MALRNIFRKYVFKAGVEAETLLKIPAAAGDPGGVANQWLWLDTTAGKLAVRSAGATLLVPLASEITGGGLTQEQIEDFMAIMIQDNADLDWTYTDNGASPGALVAVVKPDTVTYAKMQNVSATSRVLGRITAGAGDPEELTGANVRTILGTLDADTLGGQSAAAIAASAVNTILNGAGAAYDTLIEIQNLLTADDSADAAALTAIGLRSRFFAGAVPNGAPTANIDHNMAMTNIHDWTGRIVKTSDGSEPEYDMVATTLNRIVVTDDTGANIPAGLRFIGHFGV